MQEIEYDIKSKYEYNIFANKFKYDPILNIYKYYNNRIFLNKNKIKIFLNDNDKKNFLFFLCKNDLFIIDGLIISPIPDFKKSYFFKTYKPIQINNIYFFNEPPVHTRGSSNLWTLRFDFNNCRFNVINQFFGYENGLATVITEYKWNKNHRYYI